MKCSNCNNQRFKNLSVCKSCRNAKIAARRKVVGSRYWFTRKYCSVKATAKRRGKNFLLSLDEFIEIYQHYDKPCPYCDKDIKQPTIDRINNELDYTKDNCLLVCMDCNFAKSSIRIQQIVRIYETLRERSLIP